MSTATGMGKVARKFEIVVVRAVQLLLMLITGIAAIMLYVLLVQNLRTTLAQIESVPLLQEALQKGFGGVLVVLLGLELLDTVKTYFAEHRIRVEVILIVAMIAVGRHIIQLDVERTEWLLLAGLGGLMLSLAAGYFLVKKARVEFAVGEAETQKDQ